MDPVERSRLRRSVEKLSEEIEATQEEGGDSSPNSGVKYSVRDLYLPRVPANFYCDPMVFRRLLGIK
ncbi:MAG: hypothetical protein A2Y91_06585 [Chloroflexi bacterium RBG_13_54_8]|nr:MAG: hypothetical protein A2Y91_06585 [Chloroflexi bacterium RBG_13_54_8]